jgi:parallel beta-helix repeat protein
MVWVRNKGLVKFGFATAVTLVLSLVMIFYVLPVFATAVQTRYVATTGTDAGDCKGPANPCLTIQYAIGQAVSGDTIQVAAGTYNEQLTINKDNLIIQSTAGAASTIINLGQPTETTGIWITANNVVFNGFTVTGVSTTSSHAQYAIRVRGTSNTISNNKIIGAPTRDWWNDEEDSAINLDGTTATITANNIIENNEIYDFSAMGVQIVGSGVYNSHDNIIKNNNIHDIHYYAIANDRSASQTISGNTLTNIGPTGHAADGYPAVGVVVWGSQSSGTSITSQNLDGIETGIALSSAEGVTIQNSEISNNGVGIKLSGTANNNIIKNNEIHANTDGIYIKNTITGTGNQITLNNIFGSITTGVKNEAAVVINAENNWWGASSGPDDDAGVINGAGDKISTNVDADPWLHSPFDEPPSIVTIAILDTNGYTTDSTPGLTLTAGEYVPDYMAFSCNDVDFSPWIAWATTHDSFDTTTGAGCSSGDGTKTVYVKVKDTLENEQSTHSSDSTILDTTEPSVTAVTLKDSSGNTDNWIRQAVTTIVTARIHDAGSGAATTTTADLSALTGDGDDSAVTPGSCASVGGGDYDCTWTTTSGTLSGGSTVDVFVDPRDSVGNLGITGSGSATVDNTAPGTPTVTSSTHAVQTTWYSNNDPAFDWSGLTDTSGISGYSYILDTTPATTPDTTSEGTGTSTTYTNVAEGISYFHVRARDGAGNWGTAVHYTIKVDTSTPNIAAVSAYTDAGMGTPIADNTWQTDSTPYFTWTDPSSLSDNTFYYTTDGNDPTGSSSSTTSAFYDRTGSAFPDGTNTIKVKPITGAGTWGTTRTFTLKDDTSTPDAPGNLDSNNADNNVWTANFDHRFSWTAPTNSVSGIAAYYHTTDGSDPDTGSSSTTNTYFDWNGVAAGTHTVKVRAKNNANTLGGISSFTLKIDANAPVGGSINYADGYVNTATSTVTFDQGTDAESGIASVQLEKQTATLSGGTCGAYGAWSSEGTQTLGDTSRIVTLTSGTCYKFRYIATNGAGLSATSTSANVLKSDQAAPSVPTGVAATPSGWNKTNSFSLDWTNPADASGIKGAYYKLDAVPTSDTDGTWTTSKPVAGIAVSGDGSHAIYLWLKDNADNVNYLNYGATTLNYDGTAPTVQSIKLKDSSGNTEGWVRAGQSTIVTAIIYDATSGISAGGGTYAGLSALTGVAGNTFPDSCSAGPGTGNYTCTWTVTSSASLANGANVTVSVKPIDNAANLGIIRSSNLYGITFVDNTVPTITDDYASDGTWINSDQTVTLSPSDSASRLKEVKYCTGGGCTPGTVLGSPYQLSYTTEQNTIVRYQAWDKAGNPSSIGEYNVKIDKTVPTISDNYANDDVWINAATGPITLTPADIGDSGLKADPNAVKYCTGTGCDPSAGSTLSSPYQLSYATEQNTIVSYQSYDNAGSSSAVGEFIVKIDLAAPTTSDDYADANWYNTDKSITLTPADTGGSGIDWTQYCESPGCDPATGTSYTGTVTYTATGDHTFRYASRDNSGNVQVTVEKHIKIDKVNPSGSLSGVPGAWQNTDASISLSCSDIGGSGCDSNEDYYYLSDTSSCPAFPTGWTAYTGAVTVSSHKYFCNSVSDAAGNRVTTATGTEIVVDKTIPAAGVSGAPTSWINTDQTATVTCSDAGGSACDGTSYKYKVYTSDPSGVCSSNAVDYTAGSSVLVTQNSWVCSYVKDTAGNDDFSDSPAEFMVDKTAPSAVTNLGLSNTAAGAITLTWTASTDTGGSGMASQNVYRKESGGSYSLLTPVGAATTSYIDSTATHGTTWVYKVQGVDNAGNEQTAGNNEPSLLANMVPGFAVPTTDSSDATTPTNEGSLVTFTATGADVDSDQYTLLVCTTNDAGAGDCAATKICESSLTDSGAAASCTHSTAGEASESYTWYSFACDLYNACSANGNANSPYNVNHAPTITAPSIAGTYYTDSTITCTAGTASDTDAGDTASVNDYRWYFDNIEVTGQTASTLDCSVAGCDKNVVVKCDNRAKDNHDFVGDYSAQSAGNTILNSAPAITSSSSDSSSGSPKNVGQTVSFTANGRDIDSDSVTLRVYGEAGHINLLCQQTTSVAFNPSADTAISCAYAAQQTDATSNTAYIVVNDGSADSLDSTATWQVNHAPTQGVPTIAPDTSYKTSTLTCTGTGASDTDSDTTSFTYEFRDTDDSTVLQASSSTNTFDCSANAGCTKSDTIYCHVRVTDQHNFYNSANDQIISKAISNSAPALTSVSPSASYARNGDSITVTSSGAGDADSDTTLLTCGDASGNYNLCTGNLGSGERSCSFTSAWAGDAVHNVYCVLNDGTANSVEKTTTVTADNTAPALATSVNPATLTYDNTIDTVDIADAGTTTDAGAGLHVTEPYQVSYSDAGTSPDVNCSDNSYTVTTWGTSRAASFAGTDGHYYCIKLESKDAVGNTAAYYSANNVLYDISAPTTSDDSVSTIQVPSYTVTITPTDAASGVAATYWCKDADGSCTPTTDGGTSPFTVTFTSANRGVNHLRYYSTDAAGNAQEIQDKTININQLPAFTSASDDADTIKGGSTVTITTVASDADAGQTLNLFVCKAQDATSAGCGAGGTYCSDIADASNPTCSFASETDDATHNWYAYIYDSLNEAATTSQSGSYTTDSTPPTTSLVSVAGDTSLPYWDSADDSQTAIVVNGEALMSCRWGDTDAVYSSMANECAIAGTQAACNLGSLSQAAAYTMYVSCVDQYGNEQTTLQNLDVTFGVDWTPPTTTITVGSPNYGTGPTYVKSTTQFTLSPTDDPSGVASTQYKVASVGGSWIDYTIPFTVSTAGAHTIYYRSTDNAGNLEPDNTLSIFVDDTNPTAAQPTALNPYSTSPPTISWTANPGSDAGGSGLKNYEVFRSTNAIDYTSVYATADGSTTSWGDSAATNGQTYYYKVRTYDNVNNYANSSAISTTIDTQPPSVTINSPTAGGAYKSGNMVSVDASILDGGSGISNSATCLISIGGIYTASIPYSVSTQKCAGNVIAPSGLADGSNSLIISIPDNAGNVGSSSVTITIDNTPPASLSVSINDGATYATSTAVTLTLSATGATNMAFSNDGSSWSSWEAYGTSKSWPLSSGDGTKTVYFKAKDDLGNEASPATNTIILDTVAPAGSVSINGGATYTASASVTLTLSATDATSGMYQMMTSDSADFSGASWESYSATKSWILPEGDGTKTVYAKYKDSAGLVSSTYSDAIILDTTNPAVSSVTPANNAVLTTAPSYVRAVLSDNIAVSLTGSTVTVTKAGDPVEGSVSSSGSNTLIFTPSSLFANGVYTVTVVPVDNAGHSGATSTTTFTVNVTDTAGPTVTIVNPAQGSVKSGTFTAQVNAVDASGINYAQYRVVGGYNPNQVPASWVNLAYNPATGYYEASANVSVYKNNTQPQLEARAYDILNNLGTAASSVFNVSSSIVWDQLFSIGWNTITLPPITLTSHVPSSVFSSIAGKYRIIWYYNSASGQWKYYDPSDPDFSTLTYITTGEQYWVSANEVSGFYI